MKICIVAEGCYPYVVGGVSGWIHSMIKAFPGMEFVILTIISDREQSGKFLYEMPENVSAVYETYLNDRDWDRQSKRRRKARLTRDQYHSLRSVVLDSQVEWEPLIDLFQEEAYSANDLLMGADFLHIVQETYEKNYPHIGFSDFLWTMRSIYLPLFLVLKTRIPEADIYHCVATGYAGVLGAMAKYRYGCGLIVSEHGIYTREREEELLKADWVSGIYKNIWIRQFRKMSQLAYDSADKVTALYAHARELQLDLGCPEEKIQITPNGIAVEDYQELPGKLPEEEGSINVGAILRVAPIKDVKTMLRAFAFARKKLPALKLWIMGPWDEDEKYMQECQELTEALGVSDVIFTGRINVREYLGRMDFTILTSISEGQPLTILESFAAHKPVIATDVGNCRELIYGGEDLFGTAGILTHIMNTEEIAVAMVELGSSPRLREKMGNCGYARVCSRYRLGRMQKEYADIYDEIYDTMYERKYERTRLARK